jgi:DNA-binding LacI/PurR family transcriptional regulator
MTEAPERRRSVTAADVARAVGVSRSAVSRAFTPGAFIAEDTRRQVMDAAQRLGYRPNALARMLISRRSRIVGVVMGSLTNPFRAILLDRLIAGLHGADYLPVLFQVTAGSSIEALLPEILQYQPEAIVVTGFTPSEASTRQAIGAGSQVIVLNRGVAEGVPGGFISCDHVAGGRLVATRFMDAGYCRVGLVGVVADGASNRDREAGYRAGLAAVGLEPTHAVEALGYEGGVAAARALMTDRCRPDAVFCLNDLIAFGFIDGARDGAGLEPQRDYGVIGFDNSAMAAWPAYRLSSIEQPVEGLARETVAAVLRGTTGAPRPDLWSSLLPGAFVPRNSVRGEPDRAGQWPAS